MSAAWGKLYVRNYRNPLRNLRRVPSHARALVRRGRHGYARMDLWSLDGYLCSWLPAALRTLRDDGHAHPTDLTPEQWHGVLTEMAEGFEASGRLLNLEWEDDADVAALRVASERGLRLFAERFLDLWD